jgi:hypothetical protein
MDDSTCGGPEVIGQSYSERFARLDAEAVPCTGVGTGKPGCSKTIGPKGISFSANIQNLPINSHGRLISIATIWDFHRIKWRAQRDANHQKRKSVTSMELE